MENKQIIVFNTCPDDTTSRRIAEALVERHLAACVNIAPPSRSVYRWQGKIESETEQLLMIKTTLARYPGVEAAIQELHPYELPEIIAVPIIAGLPAYLNWIDSSATAGAA